MVNTNLFLRNPSLQVALTGRELGVEVVLLGEELSYLFLSARPENPSVWS